LTSISLCYWSGCGGVPNATLSWISKWKPSSD